MTAKLDEIDKNSKSEYHEMKWEFKKKSKLFCKNNNRHYIKMVCDNKKNRYQR